MIKVRFADLRKSDNMNFMETPRAFRTPGQLILSLLDERGWTKRTLAVVLGVGEATVTRIVSDERGVDAGLSIKLEELFGVPADRFLSLQMELDLAQARLVTQPDPDRANRALLYGDLPVGEMIARGWLNIENVRETAKVERELMRFFGVNRLEDIEILPHAAKKTATTSALTPAQLAWLYRVKAIAAEMPVRPYSRDKLKACLAKLKNLMIAPEEARQVSRILLECGVRFVIVETLSSAKIDGVCFWLDDKSPVIGVSIRHDRIDNFWFVLRHEIEHVLEGHGRIAAIIDAELEGERAGTGPTVTEEERVANKAAADFCVPIAQMNAFIARKAPLFSDRDLRGFARLLNVHPGIVAGQLQHRTERYQIFRAHLAKIRSFVTSSAMVDGWGTVSPMSA
jgi:HTH-type transcriptional regulator / antitoxin HigA